MKNLQQLLDVLLPVLGQEAVNLVQDELDELTGAAQEPWKKAILGLIADAVAEHGPEGVQIAINSIHEMLEGKVVALDWTDLETASDILAHLQNMEADHKTATREYVARVSQVLGTILAGLVKGFLAS